MPGVARLPVVGFELSATLSVRVWSDVNVRVVGQRGRRDLGPPRVDPERVLMAVGQAVLTRYVRLSYHDDLRGWKPSGSVLPCGSATGELARGVSGRRHVRLTGVVTPGRSRGHRW